MRKLTARVIVPPMRRIPVCRVERLCVSFPVQGVLSALRMPSTHDSCYGIRTIHDRRHKVGICVVDRTFVCKANRIMYCLQWHVIWTWHRTCTA